MTTPEGADCPAEQALRSVSGKWKPRLLRLAVDGPLRFNALLRDLPDSNKQSLALALREMEADGVLLRTVVKQKPLHVEYALTELGQSLVERLRALEP